MIVLGLLSLILILCGLISIIVPLRFLYIRSRRRGVLVTLCGMVGFVIFGMSVEPKQTVSGSKNIESSTSASRQPIEPQPTVAQEAASLAPPTDKTSLPDEQNTPSANAQLLKSLYDELQEFKSDPEFHDVGFAVCCRFNKWFARVGELQEQSDMNLFREVGVVPGELRQLGLEYMRSKGEPNSYTRSMEPKFKDGFAKHNYNPNISQRRYSGQQKLSANEFPGKWPLTVEEGTLFCEPLTRGARPMGRIAFRAPDGTTYAVNGTAQPKYPRIDPIWRSDPEIPGAEIYIGDLMEAGHALCD